MKPACNSAATACSNENIRNVAIFSQWIFPQNGIAKLLSNIPLTSGAVMKSSTNPEMARSEKF